MKPTTKYFDVSRDFLTAIDNEKTQLSFGLDNLAFMIDAIEDVFCELPGKGAFSGAMYCAFNQLQNSYAAMTELIENEYARLRGENHG